MKKDKLDRCPGCGKHCPLSAPRCKYGRAYAAKLEASQTGCKHKWEAYVTRGEPLWQMLTISRKIKKNLCHSRVTEAEVMAALTPLERQQLAQMLYKLQRITEKQA